MEEPLRLPPCRKEREKGCSFGIRQIGFHITSPLTMHWGLLVKDLRRLSSQLQNWFCESYVSEHVKALTPHPALFPFVSQPQDPNCSFLYFELLRNMNKCADLTMTEVILFSNESRTEASFGGLLAGWVCVHAHACSVMSKSMTPWAVAHQAPLFMGIFQARIQEWVAISFSKGLSQLNTGSNLCLLLWQAESLPLHRLGNPVLPLRVLHCLHLTGSVTLQSYLTYLSNFLSMKWG